VENNNILILANPTSIHTKKWQHGWKTVGFDSVICGLSNKVNQKNPYIIESDISPYGGNSIHFFKYLSRFRKILKEVNPLMINAHFSTSYGVIAALIMKRNDILVLSPHGTDIMINMTKSFIHKKVSKMVFDKSTLIVSVSDSMTDKIVRYFPEVKDKIITQQYGIDIELLDSIPQANKDVLVSTNREWLANSNYAVILEALSSFKDTKMRIIGCDDSDYSQALVSKYGDMDGNILGFIPYAENLAHVAASQIYISLTTSDGTALSLVEAMYLGAIPIVSDIEPNRELIQEGVSGFLVPIEAEALKEKIKMVRDLSPAKIQEIQAHNKALVLEKFDLKKNFKNLKNVLEEKNII
jgi:glycosyltransferase involved in cell wall biosynthesis